MNFPNDFFQDEVRCDFLVTELMKRTWAAEMKILQIVIDICERHDIPWFADSGTLLGAVRHQGFIPWDDDIDIALKREDYNKLIRILPKELPYGVVLAGMYSPSERLQQASPSNQTRVIIDEKKLDLLQLLKNFHGCPFFRIGIDIFPLDYIPRDQEFAEIQHALLEILIPTISHFDTFKADGTLEGNLTSLENLCNITLPRDNTLQNRLWRLSDAISCLYSSEDSDTMTNLSYLLKLPNYRMKKEWYDEAISLPFENMTVKAPKNYHEVLTSIYGDYMTPVKMASYHNYPCYKKQEESLASLLNEKGLAISVTEFARNWQNILRY